MTNYDDIRQGYFGRVPNELGEPLTMEEVSALEHDTQVIIIWSGGNGPHTYWIDRRNKGAVYALSEIEKEQGKRATGNPISFVGNQRFHTRIWLANPTNFYTDAPSPL